LIHHLTTALVSIERVLLILVQRERDWADGERSAGAGWEGGAGNVVIAASQVAGGARG